MAGWVEQLHPIGDLIRSLLLYLIYVVTYLVFAVLTPIIDLIRRLIGAHKPQPFTPLNPFINSIPNQPPPTPVVLPPVVELVLRATVIVGLLVVIGLVMAWALRRQSATDETGVRENRELIWSWSLLRAQLAGLLARERQPGLFGDLTGNFDDPLVWVRQAYRRVLVQALARGQARQPRQTPQTYLPTLDGLWPSDAEALRELTAAYTAARYGQLPPTTEQLASLQVAVEQFARDQPGAERR